MDGRIKQRRFFNSDKEVYLEYDATDHNLKQPHPMGGHKHLWDLGEGGKRSSALELTDMDILNNGDMYVVGEGGNVYIVSRVRHDEP